MTNKKRITKRPKKVAVTYKKTESYYAKYACPSCHTIFVGSGPDKNVIRFRCQCGQELIAIAAEELK